MEEAGQEAQCPSEPHDALLQELSREIASRQTQVEGDLTPWSAQSNNEVVAKLLNDLALAQQRSTQANAEYPNLSITISEITKGQTICLFE